MSGGKVIRTLQMPGGMPELIQLALEPLRLREFIVAEDVLTYRMHYANGQVLTLVILFVEERHLLLFSKAVISIAIVDMDDQGRSRATHLRSSIDRPTGPHDMEFCMRLMAQVAAMTRTVADGLGAGERID